MATSRWTPAVDIREDAEQFTITADIPGVEPKDIEVTMENGVLTIKGERKLEARDEGDNGYRRVERVYGGFYRRFTLPDTADAEAISAAGKHGVLEVTIPKRAALQPKADRGLSLRSLHEPAGRAVSPRRASFDPLPAASPHALIVD